MKYAEKVAVFSSDNVERFVTRVTGHHAESLLIGGSARALGSGRTIRAIQLTPGAPIGRVGGSRAYYIEQLDSNPHLPMLKRPAGGPGDGYLRW